MIARLTDWQVVSLYLGPQLERLRRQNDEGGQVAGERPAPGLPDRESFMRMLVDHMGCPPDVAAARYAEAARRGG